MREVWPTADVTELGLQLRASKQRWTMTLR